MRNRTRDPNNPEIRIKGIGTELLLKVIELTKNKKHNYIVATDVFPESRGFFEKKGFRPITKEDEKKLIGYKGLDTPNDLILELK